MTRFTVLGPLGVEADPERTPRRRARRRLLALLLLHAGAEVTRHTLIEGLWGEAPPATAVNTLQAHVSGLRRRLGPELGHLVVTEPTGYRLDVAVQDVDAGRFEAALARARAAHLDGDHDAVLAATAEAGELWRGDPYEDLADMATVRPVIDRLVELHALAQELRVGALLALGRWEDSLADLEGLVAAHPGRERLWEQLMRARWMAGRPAEALETYRRARDALLAFGLEPGVRLRHLEHEILVDDTDVAAVPLVAPRSPRSTARPRGDTHLWDLVGRQEVLARFPEVVTGDLPGLVLAGEAGVGKTRLLHECALLAGAHATRTVSFRANESLATLPLGVAGSLGALRPGPLPAQVQQLLGALASLRTSTPPIVLVDDVMHLDGATLTLLTAALEAGVARVVATLRTGEPVPPAVTRWWVDLGLDRLHLDGLARDEMHALIDAAVGPTHPGTRRRLAELAAGNPLHLREVVRAARDEHALVLAEDGRWVLESDVAGAGRLTELVGASVNRLGDAARRAFEAVALVRPISLIVLEHLVDPGAVDELESRHLVRVADGSAGPVVDVTHPLHAENVAAGLTAMRRRALGLQVSEALQARDFPLEGDLLRAATLQLAHGTLDPDLAVAASEQAVLRLDPALALRLAEVACAARPDDVHVWRLCGRAAHHGGRHDEADRHLARAQELAEDPDDQVAVASERAANLGFGAGTRTPRSRCSTGHRPARRPSGDGAPPCRAGVVPRDVGRPARGGGRQQGAGRRRPRPSRPPVDRGERDAGTVDAGPARRRARHAEEQLPHARELRPVLPLAESQLEVNRCSALGAPVGSPRRWRSRVGATPPPVTTRGRCCSGTRSCSGCSRPPGGSGRGPGGPRARATARGLGPPRHASVWPGWSAIHLAQAGHADAARRHLAAGDRDTALAEPRSALS